MKRGEPLLHRGGARRPLGRASARPSAPVRSARWRRAPSPRAPRGCRCRGLLKRAPRAHLDVVAAGGGVGDDRVVDAARAPRRRRSSGRSARSGRHGGVLGGDRCARSIGPSAASSTFVRISYMTWPRSRTVWMPSGNLSFGLPYSLPRIGVEARRPPRRQHVHAVSRYSSAVSVEDVPQRVGSPPARRPRRGRSARTPAPCPAG